VTYVLGIDGGGSTVRVVVVSSDLSVQGQSEGTSVNPNLVGRPTAMKTIQTAMKEAVANAGLKPEQIASVGMGVAGAGALHSEVWLREVAAGVLPHALVVPSGDHEIALVGAHGQRRGMLVLAGTGSLACGVGSSAEYVVVGARGYLLGDEGSGYWIGMEGLRAAVRGEDGRSRATGLTPAMLGKLGLNNVEDLIPWLYHSGQSRVRDVAALAGVVLEQAGQGDESAKSIVSRAVDELALAVRAVNFRFKMEHLPIAFAGGLLSSPNLLSTDLCAVFGLETIPLPKYPASIGAAIMALQAIGERT
jgi:N-acetylglucosamine kinase-like BadF-type ATPase